MAAVHSRVAPIGGQAVVVAAYMENHMAVEEKQDRLLAALRRQPPVSLMLVVLIACLNMS